MPAKFPCKICENPVAKNHKAIQCDKCHLWVHIKCSKINTQTYRLLERDETTIFVPKIFFHFLVLMTMTFIQLHKAKK